MKTYNLQTIYTTRQSFYGKAIVTEIGNEAYLTSYTTCVCVYKFDTKKWEIICDREALTQTTCRHIKEFLLQMTGHNYCKKDFLKTLSNAHFGAYKEVI